MDRINRTTGYYNSISRPIRGIDEGFVISNFDIDNGDAVLLLQAPKLKNDLRLEIGFTAISLLNDVKEPKLHTLTVANRGVAYLCRHTNAESKYMCSTTKC